MRSLLFVFLLSTSMLQAQSEPLTYVRLQQDAPLERVKSLYDTHQFKRLEAKDRKLGFGDDTFWFHYSYENTTQKHQDKVFLFTFYLLDYIDIYELVDGKLVLRKLMGNMRANAHYGLASKPAYVYTIQAKEKKDFFIKIKSFNVVMEYQHMDYDTYSRQSIRDTKIQFFYFGAMLIMIFYNFIIFVFIKNRSYFYYVMYHIFLLTYLVAYTNVGYSQIWTSYPWLNDYIFPMVLEIFTIFGILFAMSFLTLSKVAARLYGYLKAAIGLNTLILVISLFVPREISLMSSIVVSLSSVLLLMGVSVYVFVKRLSDNASYYLTSWIFMFLGALGTSLENFVNVQESLILKNALYIGSFLEVLLLSIGLAAFYNRLRAQKERAESANSSKSTFLANMSHEIRTPMNGIIGFVEILAKEEKEPKRKEYFEHIRNAGKSLLAIVNDILDFSKIETGKFSLEYISFHPKDLIDDIAHSYLNLCQEKGIAFHYIFDAMIPQELIGDTVRIKQILHNLLNNAYKFTAEGGEVTLDIHYQASLEQLHFLISDTGIGIEASNIQKIFDPFEQEDLSTTRKYGGTGLGLAICSRLVEMMGGKIEVKSQPGVGSSFSFSIKTQTPTLIAQSKSEDQTTPPVHFDAKALIVEDNQTNQILLGIYLEGFGLDYEIANDGLEAIAMFESSYYDLILMDENMPNMNGIQATQKIRAMEATLGQKPTPIVAVTANALKGDRERFLDAGMDDYVSKPYSEIDILRVLTRFLNKV